MDWPELEHPSELYEAAQKAVAVIAARAHGDFPAAEEMLNQIGDDRSRALAFYLVGEVTLRLLAAIWDQDIADCASDLALTLAAASS